MNDIIIVEKFQSIQAFFNDRRDQTVVHDRFRDNIGQSSAVQVLDDNPQLVVLPYQIWLHVVDNVGVLRLLHNLDLRQYQVAIRLLQQIHYFDRYLVTGGLCRCQPHRSWGTVSRGNYRTGTLKQSIMTNPDPSLPLSSYLSSGFLSVTISSESINQ